MGCDIHPIVQVKRNNKWEQVDNPEGLDNRQYNLFAVLANVRNGIWSEQLPYIDNPRGLPLDLEDVPDDDFIFGDHYDDFIFGNHSFSFVTLQELLNYNWDKEITIRAFISKEQLEDLKKGIKPNYYWSSHGVQAEWKESIRNTINERWFEILEELKQLDSDPENVRLVFGFYG